MAVNESRDMHTELLLGATEATYKSFAATRGGELDVLSNPHDFPAGWNAEDVPVQARHNPAGSFRKMRPSRGPTKRTPLR